MALNIKDQETDRLARQLAEETGQSITIAVREAIASQLEALHRRRSPKSSPEVHDVIARGRARRILDTRTRDEILGYDDHGLPR